MRGPLSVPVLIATMVAATAALAGCVADGDDDSSTTVAADEPVQANATTEPVEIEIAGAVVGGVDSTFLATGQPCGPSAECIRFPFTLEAPARVTASIEWTTAGNDLDLHLMQDGAVVQSSLNVPPATEEALTGVDLSAGDYELVVSTFASGPESFTGTATLA